MNILITGSSGHLGEALMRTLSELEYQTLGIDIEPSEFTDRIGSIANRSFVKSCMQEVDYVIHTATLHKPHVVTHSKQEFIDTNITGTLNLLEEAVAQGVKSFVFTSTTSTFGDALRPSDTSPAVWVDESLPPLAKNIYGATKTTAEDLCRLFYRNHGLPTIVLKTSRFFPEEDDDRNMRDLYSDTNLKVNEFLFRRVDIADIVDAHILALEKAKTIGFDKYIISATSPFMPTDIDDLKSNAPKVLQKYFPDYKKSYGKKGWKIFPSIGRVYVNEKARKELGWQPKYDFQHILNCINQSKDYRNPLTLKIKPKGYHDVEFEDGPFPV